MIISFPGPPRLTYGVLLDTVARAAPHGFRWTNETTADDATKEGEAIQVTFFFADPPQLSYWCARCPNLDGDPFRTAPTIVSSAGHLVLLRVDLRLRLGTPTPFFHRRAPDYFLYRAGRRPDLELLPDAVASHLHGQIAPPDCVVVSPRGDDSFVLAAVMPWPELHVFLPERRAWTRHGIEVLGGVTCPPPHYRLRKPIALGGGQLGWADLFHGVLLCDGSPAGGRFVPFPKLLPGNQRLYTDDDPTAAAARQLRDVAYDADRGLLWLVELEQLWTRRDRVDVSGRDAVHDSESLATDPATEVHGPPHERAGWRLVTWYRDISWDYWRKGGVLYSWELFGGGIATEGHLLTSYPTLQATGGGEVVYLRAMKVKGNGEWDDLLVGVDMRRKIVVSVTLVSDKGSPDRAPTYLLSALSKYA